jgi:predicted alpha/beta-fold hydrolase
MYLGIESFEALSGFSSGHVQTILGHVLNSPRVKNQFNRVVIDLDDGDQLSCRFYQGLKPVLVYLFHGLAGSVDSGYMHRMTCRFTQLGFSVLSINHRGCGDGQGLAKSTYHSGRAKDITECFVWGRKRFPHFKHIAIGFSLSGNALLLQLGKQTLEIFPDFAISVNAPINLEKTAQLLCQGLNRIYDFMFYKQCRKDAYKIMKTRREFITLPKISTIYKFDELITAPFSQFKNREDYYTQCSAKKYIENIKCPTVLLTSSDDPFVPVGDYTEIVLPPGVTLRIEKEGGHMGYISKKHSAISDRRWMDHFLVKSTLAFLSQSSGDNF